MKLKLIVCGLAAALLTGCAGVYMAGWGGPTATVVYIQDTSKEHVFSASSGDPIPPSERDLHAGDCFSSRHGTVQSTAVYAYESGGFTDHPALLGSCGKAPCSRTVKAGVPLPNLYRTRYQTSSRHSYKCFYTTSVFTPKPNARYEVIVEPIDGVVVYQLLNGKRVRVMDVAKGPAHIRF